MNTQENNKLIAEFMGGTLSSVPNLINLPQTRGDANIHSVKGSEMLPNGTYSVHRLNELKYHSSWDWLMPVVDKIESDERFDVNILQYGTIISSNTKERGHIEIVNNVANISFDSKIDHTYKAVVEFIKQYNNQ